MAKQGQKYLVVSVEGVHPSVFDETRRLLDTLSSEGIDRRSIGVIPEFSNEESLEGRRHVASLKKLVQKPDELVLQGYTGGHREFSRLRLDAVTTCVHEGYLNLRAAGFTPRGFIGSGDIPYESFKEVFGPQDFIYVVSPWGTYDLREHQPTSTFSPVIAFPISHLAARGYDLAARVLYAHGPLDEVPLTRVTLRPEHGERDLSKGVMKTIDRLRKDRQLVTYEGFFKD